MATNKTELKKSSHKFTLKQFVWNGFNFTVGVQFLGSLALLADTSSNQNPGAYGLGFHIIWIFLLMGIIASVCAYAFAKLSRYHKQDTNGGAYIFARSAFGRFVGFLILFLNYIIMPMVLANQILMFVKANFDPLMSAGSADGGFWWCDWTKHLNNWSYLTYDLIGLALAVVFAMAAFFGAKTYKKVAKYSLLIKWISSGFLIAFGIIAAALPVNSNNASQWAHNSTFNFSHFLSAFCACFYYFTGFEAFASAGSTIKQPEKNVSKGIMMVMILSVGFYIVMITIFMLAQSQFMQNINTGFWIILTNADNSGWFHWLIYAGPIIMIVCTIAMRGNTISQAALYGGTTLQPMSTEGYISHRFSEINSEGFPIGAMKLHITISLITICTWAIVPDIIVGIVGSKANFININTIISAASVFYIIIYAIILLAVMKYALTQCIRNTVIEWILYPLTLVSLVVVIFDHFYDLFNNALRAGATTSDISALIIEMLFFSVCAIFVISVYFAYYRKRYRIRMIINPKLQTKLNYEFRTLDGWSFLKGKFYVSAINFFEKRSKLVNENYEDLTDPRFRNTYKKSSEKFLRRTKVQLMRYLKHSEYIQKHDEKTGLNVKKEIFQNNQEAVKFLSQLQRQIRSKPSNYLYLSSLRK